MTRRIWAISDPHLSFANPKPMDIFGSHWRDHAARIEQKCRLLIEPTDLLLIPGDISWAMKRKDAEVDLQFLAALPGIKVLCKGNHDYWWNSDKPLAFDGLHDTPFMLEDRSVGVAGTRGWAESTADMSAEERLANQTIISREVRRLRKRLDTIASCTVKYVIVHYPPIQEFHQLLVEHEVDTIVYGHLHLGGAEQILAEDWHGIRAVCVAADRLNFTPKLLNTL